MQERNRGISGATLKWFAIISMLIDHIGAALLAPVILGKAHYLQNVDRYTLIQIYTCMREFGRLAFPIFCFLLIEGIRYTKNRKKYFLQMLLFALVSEVPFDLAFHGKIMDWNYQNVFWTLMLGMLAVYAAEYIMLRMPQIRAVWMIILLLLCVVAELTHVDYGATGVVVIVVMWSLQKSPVIRGVLCTLILIVGASVAEWTVVFSFLLIACYNGTRGKQWKYFFYLFYPAHLLILGILHQLCVG